MEMTHEPAGRFALEWETVAVSPLPPGWFTRYKQDDGSEGVEPCAALLLQEHRRTTKYWDEPVGDGTFRVQSETRPEAPPYSTRVVFSGNEIGELGPADDVGNFIGVKYDPGLDLSGDNVWTDLGV